MSSTLETESQQTRAEGGEKGGGGLYKTLGPSVYLCESLFVSPFQVD